MDEGGKRFFGSESAAHGAVRSFRRGESRRSEVQMEAAARKAGGLYRIAADKKIVRALASPQKGASSITLE